MQVKAKSFFRVVACYKIVLTVREGLTRIQYSVLLLNG